MAVDGRAQVVHDTLADLVGQQRLVDADHAGGDRRGDHPEHEPRQVDAVLVGQGHVQHFAQQERRHQADQRRDPDEGADRAQAGLVGDEEPQGAAQIGLADCRIARPLYGLILVSP